MRDTGTSVVAWIALIVAIIALTLGWVAFNRTGEDLENKIQQQVEQRTQDLQQGAQEGAQNVEEGTREGTQRLDEGPDGVDEDDTGTGTGTTPEDPNTTQQ